MEEEKWSTDEKVLELLEQVVKKVRTESHISVGNRLITWTQILAEVKEGTRFGRRYYRAFLQTSAVKELLAK